MGTGIHYLKRCYVIAIVAILVSAAARATEEAATWGKVEGLSEPHPDSKGRDGYWWWPHPVADQSDVARPVGNRGRVFGPWVKPERETIVSCGMPLPSPPSDAPPPICKCAILLNNILFDFDKAVLKPEGKAEIDKLVAEMTKFGNDTLVCIGHTDDVGPAEYNMILGEKRAQAVKDYMVEKGVASDRIGVKSMGESEPAVPNDSRPNRALNRRVVFQITVRN